jgi:hypothetical protein
MCTMENEKMIAQVVIEFEMLFRSQGAGTCSPYPRPAKTAEGMLPFRVRPTDEVPGWSREKLITCLDGLLHFEVETWRSHGPPALFALPPFAASQLKDFFASDHDSDNSSFNSPVASILTMVSIT